MKVCYYFNNAFELVILQTYIQKKLTLFTLEKSSEKGDILKYIGTEYLPEITLPLSDRWILQVSILTFRRPLLTRSKGEWYLFPEEDWESQIILTLWGVDL